MSKNDAWMDPSKEAEDHLNSVLVNKQTTGKGLFVLDDQLKSTSGGQEKIDEVLTGTENEVITVSQARKEEPILDRASERQRVRLLIFTKDASILVEGSESHRRVIDLSQLFLEIHVIVLTFATVTNELSIERLSNNMWFYSTNSTSWWKLSYDGYMAAESQLVFSGGFRADVVIAEDPFEAGLAGWFLSRKYERPFQLHIYEDFFDDSFIEAQEHPTFYAWSVTYLMKRVLCIRTKSEFQRLAVIEENPDLELATELLPKYYNLESWKNFTPTMSLTEKYPQFKFIILHITSMHTSSHSIDVLSGAAIILHRYPTIGLVIVGNGPLRAALERQVIALGVQNQVEFEPSPTEILSYIKSANVLVHLSEDGNEDDVILEAAAAKLPMIANTRGLAGKLFVDGESACLCEATDIACVADNINMYLNENQNRAHHALRASEIVFERIEQDYGAYLEAYSESIERCITTAS